MQHMHLTQKRKQNTNHTKNNNKKRHKERKKQRANQLPPFSSRSQTLSSSQRYHETRRPRHRFRLRDGRSACAVIRDSFKTHYSRERPFRLLYDLSILSSFFLFPLWLPPSAISTRTQGQHLSLYPFNSYLTTLPPSLVIPYLFLDVNMPTYRLTPASLFAGIPDFRHFKVNRMLRYMWVLELLLHFSSSYFFILLLLFAVLHWVDY
ncbi:hypothetical protein M752DRAFT_75234 [Aspergillus phoenicis ATCC 13157]|uniref:Uncharacterized protein n=1 Tax=Aspergillus phoenicis ATCC 13157 TaxID=1353007 RepID=A0A370P9Q5_ASPPH|nr:hypothetical protein M752DRAFT_75234 [Aspergillus phoenicis ATCC 13157]